MIVAACAADRQAKPDCAGGFNSVNDVLDLCLGRDCAALTVEHMVAVEAGGDELAE